ncbi:tetratricopeptide repeat protein [Bacteroidota bacterium]
MDKIKKYHCYIVLTVLTFIIFYNSLDNEFVFDDESVVVNNLSLQDFSNIPKYFSGSEGFHKVIGRYYRPIVSSTYTVDYAIWELNPLGYHLTNIIIHIISCLLLFAVLAELFGKYKYGILASLIASLIFASHPIHTEAVSWVSGRTDSLVTLFFFASLLYYIKFTKRHDNIKESSSGNNETFFTKYKLLLISILFYFAGLLSKEMIITYPVVVILFDFVYRKKPLSYIKKNLIVYVSVVVVTLLYLLLRYIALEDVVERESYVYFYEKDFATVAVTMLKTIPLYFKLLFFPIGLLYHYNGYIPDSVTFFDINVILSIIFIIGIIFMSVIFYKRNSVISFCLLFFVVSLIPVMNIIPTMNLMAERFLYMTSFSLSIVIVYLIVKFINEKNSFQIIVSTIVIVLLLSFLTFDRNKDWKDNDTLYSTAEGVDGTVLLTNVGNIYANKKQYDEADWRYRRAIELRDNSLLAHHNLGLIFMIRGQLDSAEIKFKKGLSIDSLAPDGYLQLANVYQAEGRIDEAIQQLEKLQSIFPDYRNSKVQLELLRASSDSELPPGVNPPEKINAEKDMLDKRSYQFYQDKKFKEAIKDLEKLILIAPELQSGYINNIALCYEGLGDLDNAEKYLRMALQEDEMNINAYNGLAGIFLKKGNKEKAIEQYQKVLTINPNDENALHKIDSLGKN